jgi:hypothetical protein
MKKLMITGALAGFGIGVVSGLANQLNWSSIMWRASVSAAVAGFVLRWWGQVWINGLQQAYDERMAAAEALEAQRAVSEAKAK